MASFPRIRVPWEKSAGSGDFLYSPIGYQDKSDRHTISNSLEGKGFIAGRMRTISTRLPRLRPPLLAKEGRAIGPGFPSAPSRLRVPPFSPRNLACPQRGWYLERPPSPKLRRSEGGLPRYTPAAAHHPLKGA
jgi:hypothetical protein